MTDKKKIDILSFCACAIILLITFTVIKRNVILPGWHSDKNGNRYYIELPFKKASGFKDIGGNTYLFSNDSRNLLYGFNKYDGFYYYSDENGIISKGRKNIDGKEYYFNDTTGKMYKENIYIVDGKLWYFDEYGFKQFGIIEIDGEKYCFNENGNLKKGLQKIDGKYYYFDKETEAMKYGLVTIGGAVYYFGDDGAALTGEQVINGEKWTFDSEGKRISEG